MRLKARGLLLSTVSALALSGTASAQTWTGFYVGGHGGVGWLHHEQTLSSNATFLSCNPVATRATCSFNDTGAVLGAQAGYNLQLQQWVFGFETDVSWTSLKKTASFNPNAIPGFSHNIHNQMDWLASVRGRLGLAVNDWLFYGTGGVAFANVKAGFSRANSVMADQISTTTVGWVAGGGIEKAFSRNWSARAEFLHYGFARAAHSAGFFGNTYTTSFRNDVSVVRLGINFRPNP